MRAARAILIVVGVAVLVLGVVIMFDTVRPNKLIGLLIWLAAAVIIHDGILSPLVFGANFLLRKSGRRIPGVVLAIVQVAVVIGVIMTLLVVPEIYAKTLGTKNDTVLPLDYGLHLGIMWAIIAVVAAGASVVALALRKKDGSADAGQRRTSKQNVRPSTS